METTDHQTGPTPPPGTSGAGNAPPGADRLINVPGMRNLRDAGGFRTSDGGRIGLGLLYRSASLHDLSQDGAARLAALGLRTVVDLRSAEEIVHWPNQRHGLDFELVSLPTLPSSQETSADPNTAADQQYEGLPGMYALMADTAGPPIVACVRRLTAPGALPALVHCAVGKDRTGITIAVVLSALGVDDDDITADYALSNAGLGLLEGPVRYLDEHGEEHLSYPVRTELLALFLQRVHDRHGTTAAFLRHHGLAEDELARLRELLVRFDGA